AGVGAYPGLAALGQPAAGGRAVVVGVRPRRLRQPASARGAGRRPRAVHLGPAVAPAAGAAGTAARRPAAALGPGGPQPAAAGGRDRGGRLAAAGGLRTPGRRTAAPGAGGDRPQPRQASARPAVLAVQ